MRPCFFAVHDARQAGVAVPVDVVARVGPVVAAEPGGVQARVDDGSVVAGHNPAVRPPAQESILVCTSLLIRPGGPNRKLIGPVDRGRPRGPEGRAGPEHPERPARRRPAPAGATSVGSGDGHLS